MTLAAVVAVSSNDGIGMNGDLPWHLPGDLRRFRKLTLGHAVIVGHLTQESIVGRLGRPLPDRHTVMLTRTREAADSDVVVATSPRDAAAIAARHRRLHGQSQAFVIGGATVYRAMLPMCTRIFLTRVHAVTVADTFMPGGWLDGFMRRTKEDGVDSASGLAFSFEVWQRNA